MKTWVGHDGIISGFLGLSTTRRRIVCLRHKSLYPPPGRGEKKSRNQLGRSVCVLALPELKPQLPGRSGSTLIILLTKLPWIHIKREVHNFQYRFSTPLPLAVTKIGRYRHHWQPITKYTLCSTFLARTGIYDVILVHSLYYRLYIFNSCIFTSDSLS